MYKKVKYVCEYCGDDFDNEESCLRHEEKEKARLQVNKMLKEGKSLGEIQEISKFWRNGIPEYLKNVTNKECFKIPFWQYCEKPAYQIQSITLDGNLILGGCGGFYGYREGCCKITDNHLKQAFPKEKLFVYHS